MSDTKNSRLSFEEVEQLVPELLYGELDDSRAEQVRAQLPEYELEAKVAAYERMREVFRSLPDEEPPPAISAQLLHAAAKQVKAKPPGESAGLWDKLHSWFAPIVMHPGLAAAASMLVIGGVVGVLYLKGGDQIAQPDVSTRAAAPEMKEATLAPAASPPALEGRLGDNLNGQPVTEQEADRSSSLGAGLADAPPPAPVSKPEAKPADKRKQKQRAANRRGRAKKDEAGFGATGKSTGLIGSGDSAGRYDRGLELGETDGPAKHGDEGGAATPAEDPAPAPVPQAEPSDDSAPAATKSSPRSKRSQPSSKRSQKKKAPSRSKGSKADPHADARRLHSQARAAAEKGDCTSARKLSARIQKMDPVYYRDAVRDDRQLGKCRDVGKK